mgnify:CR=1 FL=1
MGPRAKGFLDEFGIQVIAGVNGNIKEVSDKFLNGTLKGGESWCKTGAGKNYGVDKSACNHSGTGDKAEIYV